MLNVRDGHCQMFMSVAQMVRKAFIISKFNLTWTNTSQTWVWKSWSSYIISVGDILSFQLNVTSLCGSICVT